MASHPGNPDWVRLGRLIAAQRGALGHRSRERYARSVGVSDSLMAALEAGRRANFRDSTVEMVTAGLGWAPGEWREVLAGAEPQPDLARAVRPVPHVRRTVTPVDLGVADVAAVSIHASTRLRGVLTEAARAIRDEAFERESFEKAADLVESMSNLF